MKTGEITMNQTMKRILMNTIGFGVVNGILQILKERLKDQELLLLRFNRLWSQMLRSLKRRLLAVESFLILQMISHGQKQDIAYLRKKLNEDLKPAKIRKAVAECLINSAVFGTGIGEVVLEEIKEMAPAISAGHGCSRS